MGENGKITEEDIRKIKLKVGYAYPSNPLWNEWTSIDSIRHFTEGYGDDNPLYSDINYAKNTQWGSIIAPPMYFLSTGVNIAPKMPEDVKKEAHGALRGVNQFYGGGEMEWFRPITPGVKLYRNAIYSDVEVKHSEKFESPSVIVHREILYFDEDRVPYVRQHEWFVHTDRKEVSKVKKTKEVTRQEYTEEDLAKIEELYANEHVQGSAPQNWENVNEGDDLPKMVKGPMLVTDIISHHMGLGWGGFLNKPLKLGYKNRRRIPNFYTKNEFGVWDVVQRVHWDEKSAQQIGAPYSYDYGVMRTTWLTHFVSNWMGDNAWLWKFKNKITGFNYVGDTSFIEGKVVKKYVEQGLHCVDIDIICINNRNEQTISGTATVILPVNNDNIRLPEVPARIQEVANNADIGNK
jgi:acyl dehydratase